jgi:hypothetical protein
VTLRKHHFPEGGSFLSPSSSPKREIIIFAMAHQGQSADYYNNTSAPQQPQDAYYQGQPQQYGQQPPQYNQNFGQNYAPPTGPPPAQQQNGYQQDGYGGDSKTFEQQFKLDKPKYNDLWAGLLFIAVFLGYVAVSAISIRGYSNQHSGGIYGNKNQFALNSNTIILFAFVLGMATLFSYAYIWAARAFTKQFIWITGILSKFLSIDGWVWNNARSFEELNTLTSYASCSMLI